jgi:uncharacterized protein YjbI with pentapeptide repeats
MGGALIAFAVLGLQLMIQVRAEIDSNNREDQAARQEQLLVLGRSRDLSGLDLIEDDLADAYLNSKVLRGARLSRANMERATIQDSDLTNATLQDADLDKSRLHRSDFRYADLSEADMNGAFLNGANFDAAILRKVELVEADLSNASVRADLTEADLRNAKLIGARLAPANLRGADLRGADFEFADLRGADLSGAKLRGTPGTAFRDARNLHDVRDWSGVIYDSQTTWPDSFEWEGVAPSNKKCDQDECRLDEKTRPVNDFPRHIRDMQDKLALAVNGSRKGRLCLPGWRVGETKLRIVVHAPRDSVRFEIQTWPEAGTNARIWATDEFGYENLDPRPGSVTVSVDGVRSAAYAERIRTEEDGSEREEVAVYFISHPPEGIRIWGGAAPESFNLYQRDFLKLFRALGVKGDLFPALRGDKDPCPV